MKKIILFLITPLMFYSQEIGYYESYSYKFDVDLGVPKIGFLVGANFSNVIVQDTEGIVGFKDSKTRPGINAGIYLGFKYIEEIGFDFGVSYSQQGFETNTNNNKYLYDLNYINITFGARYYFSKYFSLGILPTIGFNIKAEEYNTTSGERLNLNDYPFDYYDQNGVVVMSKRSDAFSNINFNVGLQATGNYEDFELGLRYSIGLTNLISVDSHNLDPLNYTAGFPSSLKESTFLVYLKYSIRI